MFKLIKKILYKNQFEHISEWTRGNEVCAKTNWKITKGVGIKHHSFD